MALPERAAGVTRGMPLAMICVLVSCSRSETSRDQPRPPPPAASELSAPVVLEPAAPPVLEPLRRVEPAPPLAIELPELERERLAYLFDAAGLVTRSWPQLSAAETCLLLIAQKAQWVVNCQQAPAGFSRIAGQFRGRPLFAHAGETFEVGGQARSTRQLLAQTPAAAHVFAPDRAGSALPAKYPWLLIGTLEALREFHPAFGPATTESWLSVAMHELVHIHQLRQPGFAPYLDRIDAHTLHPGALAALYEEDPNFKAQIAREYTQLVAAAMRAVDPAVAKRALRTWLRSYRQRSARLRVRSDAEVLLHDERLFTYLEGVGRYVESDFLLNAAQHPAAGLESDPQFHRFEAFLGRGYAASPNRQLDTEYYYAIGYHLCVLLDRVDPSWRRRVDAQPGWLIGLIEEAG